jgi:predicted ester cyclase
VTVEEQMPRATWWLHAGRGAEPHDGELMGIPPAHKQVTVTGLNYCRLRNGRIVEEWDNWDTLGMLRQIGAVPEM